ncbi:MAG: spore germination protein [Clostridiales bacterium]|nr:spore germination protein [Clostridiales bacterium]
MGWMLFHIRHLENVCPDKMKVGYGLVTGKWIGAIYMARFFLNGMALFYFFGLSIHKIYMPDASMFQILLPFAVLLWYCCQTTLQKRARFLEALFPWILVLFIILIVLAFVGLEGNLHVPSLQENASILLENSYLLLLCATPLEFLLILVPATTENLWESRSSSKGISVKREAEGNTSSEDTLMNDILEESISARDSWCRERRNLVWKSVAGVCIWNVLLWFVTIQNLGGELTASTPWPVIKVMQLIRLPGGFLERFDILLAVFWILCLVGVLSGYLYYGRRIGEETFGKKISDTRTLRTRTAALTAGVIFLMFFACGFLTEEAGQMMLRGFLFYKKWIDFPLLILLPLCPWFFHTRLGTGSAAQSGASSKKSKKAALTVLLLCMIALCGCGKQEDVEDKSYVLSLYVDVRENDYEYWIFTADLGEMGDREESIPCDTIYLVAGNMEEMEEKYEKTETGPLEWNHVETIFLGSNLAENEEKLMSFLREWEADWQKTPDVLLMVCLQSAEELENIEGIPEGTAGQEIRKLAEQEEQDEGRVGKEIMGNDSTVEEVSEIYCRTPIEVLKARAAGEKHIILYQTRVASGQLILD